MRLNVYSQSSYTEEYFASGVGSHGIHISLKLASQ